MSLKIKKMLLALALVVSIPFVCGAECSSDPNTKVPRIEIQPEADYSQ